MIAPFEWLWKQFRGPQITGIAQAILEYFKQSLDTTLEYWNTLSINKSTSDHLTTIGALQGVARPLMLITPETFFWFSEVPQEGTYYPSVPYAQSEHGVSDLSDITYGGKFADIEDAEKVYGYINTALFRNILQSIRDSKGALGSLECLDDIVYGLFKYLSPTATPDYIFQILNEEDVQDMNRSPGDVKVNLGTSALWGEGFDSVVAEINLLGKTIYYPVPTIFATANI